MTDPAAHGLSRRQLEYELRWLMNQAPTDPARLADFLGRCMVTLIDKNNAALARSAAEANRPDLPERR